MRERIELLDAADRDIGRRGAPLAADQIDIHLAAAQHEAPDRARRGCARPRSSMTDRKRPSLELERRRRDRRMAQQALRRQDEQRQRIVSSSAAWRRSRWKYCAAVRAVDEAQVDVGRGLQEALGARARMIGPLAFVAVRQQEHERRHQSPLGAAGGDELVEHHLGAVDEVAVLRFPDHQAPGVLHVVAELEADRRVLGQRAVVNLERRSRLRQLLQRHELRAGVRVVKHGVALAERAALDVLAGQADRRCRRRGSSQTPAPRRSPSRPCARRDRQAPCRRFSRARSSFL